MLQKCDILLWNFGKWDFPHVTHFRFFGWVLGRFPEIVYPVNVEHCLRLTGYWLGFPRAEFLALKNME